MFKWIICFCCFFLGTVQAHPLEQLQPYLLPDDHPLKPTLDQIFSHGQTHGQPLKDLTTLRKAGFKFHLRKDRFMIVASHKKLKGYLVKLYLDSHTLREGEWVQWLRRAQGAEQIRKSIEEHGYQELLLVPKKWIYAVPNANKRHYVLLVENMRIVSYGKNEAKYRFMMNEELLEALFVILKENLLIDSLYLDNIPFCKDHTIAFIDTEHFLTKNKPVPYQQILPYLSPKMQKYWKLLIEKYKS